MKYVLSKAITVNPNTKKKFYFGKAYYALLVEFESIINEKDIDKNIIEYISNNQMEPDEFIEFVNACPENYDKYKISYDIQNLNNYFISRFDGNEISKYLDTIKCIYRRIDLVTFKKHIEASIPNLKVEFQAHKELLRDIVNVGNAMAVKGRIPFTIPEEIASNLLETMPKNPNSLDLLLSIIRANINKQNATHIVQPVCSAMLQGLEDKGALIKSYTQYLDFNDLVSFTLLNPNNLCKNSITDIVQNNDEIQVEDFNKIISRYSEMKQNIFEGKNELCSAFIMKLSKSFQDNKIKEITIDNLSYIIPIIKDNHGLNNNFINSLLSHSNNLISQLDKETWLNNLKQSQNSKLIELFVLLISINKLNINSKPENAISAYQEVVKLTLKKDIAIPTNSDFWNVFFDFLSTNFTTLYKDVRDELLNHNHSQITNEELYFYEKGLFKYGKLDENPSTADDSLRRILKPLISNDAKFIGFLKRNASKIKAIAEDSNDTIIDFSEELKSKCPGILNEPDFQEVLRVLSDKVKKLTPQPPEVIITLAKYGIENKYIDITDKIKEQVVKGINEIMANNELAGIDPFPGKTKELIIEYTVGAENKRIVIPENEAGKIE